MFSVMAEQLLWDGPYRIPPLSTSGWGGATIQRDGRRCNCLRPVVDSRTGPEYADFTQGLRRALYDASHLTPIAPVTVSRDSGSSRYDRPQPHCGARSDGKAGRTVLQIVGRRHWN